jgi:hypothetical protein
VRQEKEGNVHFLYSSGYFHFYNEKFPKKKKTGKDLTEETHFIYCMIVSEYCPFINDIQVVSLSAVRQPTG